MFIKGFALDKTKYDAFRAACAKPTDEAVSVYEWGYGPCDDFMTALKAQTNPLATTFTAAATAKTDGSGHSDVKATFSLNAGGTGLYVIFENLMGAPVSFKEAQLAVAGLAEPIKSLVDLVYPAATVHMSAAIVELGDEVPVEAANVTFGAKGTALAGAKPTAMMVLNKEQLKAEHLGCTFGFYFGWFKKNTMGQNVCQGAAFDYTIADGILTLNGVIKAVTPETSAEILKGDIQVDPAYALFQGDGKYSFAAKPHGADSVYVVIPNRLDTPVTIENLAVTYDQGGLMGMMADPSKLASGPVAGVVIAVLLAVFALMSAAYCAGRRGGKGQAAQVEKNSANSVV